MKTATKTKIVSFVERVLGLKRSNYEYAKEVKVSRTYFLQDFKSKEAEADILSELAAELECRDLITHGIITDSYSDVDTVTVAAKVFVV